MTTVLKELENLIMVLLVNFTVARAPDSFRANYDTYTWTQITVWPVQLFCHLKRQNSTALIDYDRIFTFPSKFYSYPSGKSLILKRGCGLNTIFLHNHVLIKNLLVNLEVLTENPKMKG